jgi:hypothetical protein
MRNLAQLLADRLIVANIKVEFAVGEPAPVSAGQHRGCSNCSSSRWRDFEGPLRQAACFACHGQRCIVQTPRSFASDWLWFFAFGRSHRRYRQS